MVSFVRYDYSNVPAFWEQRQALLAQVAEGFKSGAVTRNEYRRALGLPQLDTPQGERFVISPMMVEVPLVAGSTEQVIEEEQGKILHLPERVKKKATL